MAGGCSVSSLGIGTQDTYPDKAELTRHLETERDTININAGTTSVNQYCSPGHTGSWVTLSGLSRAHWVTGHHVPSTADA